MVSAMLLELKRVSAKHGPSGTVFFNPPHCGRWTEAGRRRAVRFRPCLIGGAKKCIEARGGQSSETPGKRFRASAKLPHIFRSGCNSFVLYIRGRASIALS